MAENPGETSGGDSLTPPPSVSATPQSQTVEESSQGSTLGAGPAVAATPGGHTEVEPLAPGGPEEAAKGSTLAVPTVAASLGSSPGPTAGGLPGAGLGQGEAAAGSTLSVAVAAATAKDATTGLADPELGKGPLETSPSRTGALPAVAATPDPLAYGHLGTS